MRVTYGNNIFFSEPRFGAENQFGIDIDPLQWRSLLPGASFLEALTIDPSLQQSFAFGFDQLDQLGRQLQDIEGTAELADTVIRNFIANERSALASTLSQMAASDIVTALRSVIGQVAITVGFTSSVMTDSVRRVYSEPLQGVMIGLSIANSVFESPAFQSAIDNITWIPVIGWIIQIVLGILTLIAKIGDEVRRKRMKKMSVELAMRFHLPLIDSDPDLQQATNEAMTRQVLQLAQSYHLEKVFYPPYLTPNGSWKHFEAIAARAEGGPNYVDEYGNSAELTQAWYLVGKAGGGVGFAPGGTQLIRTLEFYPEACGGAPGNTGRYMATATGIAGYLWQVVLQNGPAMFCVATEQTKAHWDDFAHGLLEYGEKCIRTGFTCSQSGYPCSRLEWCGDWNYGANNCDRASDRGKKVERPVGGPSHFEELVLWVTREFWGRGSDKNSYPYDVRATGKEWSPDNFYFQNTIHGMALDNLRARQLAVLGDYTAMLVTPATTFEDPSGKELTRDRGMFPALATDATLRARWEETVTRIVNDPELVHEVDYTEIPAYRWAGQSLRETVRQKQQQKGVAAGAGAKKRRPIAGGPSDYPPPSPPDLAGVGLALDVARVSSTAPSSTPSTSSQLSRTNRTILSALGGFGVGVAAHHAFGWIRRSYFT